MYLSDLIRNIITQKLQEICINHNIEFEDIDGKDHIILCSDVSFQDDDGDCWIVFTDDKNQDFTVEGQGIDIWFKVLD